MPQNAAGTARYTRDTPEFARVAALSDGVFAIAMTLLVLGLEVPDPRAAPLAEALRERLPNLIAYVLGFGLVANAWWSHHRFVGQLGAFDATLVRTNLVFLGAIALVPFPTGLVGGAPTDRWAVMPFIAVFVVLLVMMLAMVRHAQRHDLWRWPLPASMYRWVRASWLAAIAGMCLAVGVSAAVPVAGLVVAALSGSLVEPLIARLAPRGYSEWA